jgi:hypothetical protein
MAEEIETDRAALLKRVRKLKRERKLAWAWAWEMERNAEFSPMLELAME